MSLPHMRLLHCANATVHVWAEWDRPPCWASQLWRRRCRRGGRRRRQAAAVTSLYGVPICSQIIHGLVFHHCGGPMCTVEAGAQCSAASFDPKGSRVPQNRAARARSSCSLRNDVASWSRCKPGACRRRRRCRRRLAQMPLAAVSCSLAKHMRRSNGGLQEKLRSHPRPCCCKWTARCRVPPPQDRQVGVQRGSMPCRLAAPAQVLHDPGWWLVLIVRGIAPPHARAAASAPAARMALPRPQIASRQCTPAHKCPMWLP